MSCVVMRLQLLGENLFFFFTLKMVIVKQVIKSQQGLDWQLLCSAWASAETSLVSEGE